MAQCGNLQKAIDLVTKATEEDKKQNYQEALHLYQNGVEYFLHAMKYETQGDKQKETLRNKCITYLERAEKLEEYLRTGKGDKKKPVTASGGDNDSNKDDDDPDDAEKKRIKDRLSDFRRQLTQLPFNGKLEFSPYSLTHYSSSESPTMTQCENLQKAINLFTMATEDDKQQNYQEALHLYQNGVEYMLQALKYEVQGDKQKEVVRRKCITYLERAEKLEEYFRTGKGDKKKSVKASSGDNDNNKDDDDPDDVEKKRFKDRLSDFRRQLTQ